MLTGAFLASILIPTQANAIEGGVHLSLQPFCEKEVYEDTIFGPVPSIDPMINLAKTGCPVFEVEDPETAKTYPLKKDDTLDIQIALSNLHTLKVKRIRSWISYDPDVLEGVSIELSDDFPVVTPGESDFDSGNGYAKIEVSAEEGKEVDVGHVRFARIKFKVKETNEEGTYISFYDTDPAGHTLVTANKSGEEEQVLESIPGTLHVIFGTNKKKEEKIEEKTEEKKVTRKRKRGSSKDDEKKADGESCNVAEQCESRLCESGLCIPNLDDQRQDGPLTGSVSDGEGAKRTAFSLLQVRTLRITTEGSSIFLSWDKLKSSALKAYNVYYGTTSGRYIHRRTVPEASNTLTIRALPIETTYFVSVRAVSKQDEESAFSKEVSVIVGDPESSTSPLIPGMGGDTAPPNPLEGSVIDTDLAPVPGETGAPPLVVFLLVGSAVIGTIFAFRRQVAVTKK